MILWQSMLLGWLVMSILMTGLWLIQRRTHNAGIVDIAWSFGTGLMGAWFALCADGYPGRRWLVGVLAGIWGIRLGSYLFKRVMSESEDGRYTMLRERWGKHMQARLFVFFQLQAAWAVLFALPTWAAADNPATGLQWFDYTGLVVWVIAVAGESIADAQLSRFRSKPDNKGKVCDRGLWRYSRHPNYFFEWVGWWSYVLIAVGSPYFWVAIGGPIVMYLFITKVTGIPLTEKQAIRSRGDAYRRYQHTTNALFPGPPRRSET